MTEFKYTVTLETDVEPTTRNHIFLCSAITKALQAASEAGLLLAPITGATVNAFSVGPDFSRPVEDAPALLGYQFGRGGWSIAGDDDDPTGGASWEIIPPEHAEAWREEATAGGSDAELMPIHDNGCIEEPTFIGPPGAQ